MINFWGIPIYNKQKRSCDSFGIKRPVNLSNGKSLICHMTKILEPVTFRHVSTLLQRSFARQSSAILRSDSVENSEKQQQYLSALGLLRRAQSKWPSQCKRNKKDSPVCFYWDAGLSITLENLILQDWNFLFTNKKNGDILGDTSTSLLKVECDIPKWGMMDTVWVDKLFSSHTWTIFGLSSSDML